MGRLTWALTGLGLAATIGVIWSTPVGSTIAVAADRVVKEIPRAAGHLPFGSSGSGAKSSKPQSRPQVVAGPDSGSEDDERQLASAPRATPAASASGTHEPAGGSATVPPRATVTPPASVADVATPTVNSLLASQNRYFGLYTAEAPFNWKQFDSISDQIGYQPQLVGYFQGWDKPFRADAVVSAWKHGQAPLLTWEPIPSDTPNNVVDVPGYSLSNIVDGDFDSYLHTYARSVAATGKPVIIRLAHEMNSTWYPWAEDDGHGNSINGNQQGDYVRMWQHVHDVFQSEGANQYVAWLWSPNIINNLTKSHTKESYLRSLYPGDAYVDLVGLSGYLRPNYKADNTFTFSYTFGRSLNQLRDVAPGKRILLSEVASSDVGGHKAAWTQSVFDALQSPANDDIIGLAWFDRDITTVLDGASLTNDFRLETDPAALAAVRAALTAGTAGFGALPAE